MGYRLVKKMGWQSGTGLGRDGQGTSFSPLSLLFSLYCRLLVHYTGRREPIPFELKDDNMGLGRWSYEVQVRS